MQGRLGSTNAAKLFQHFLKREQFITEHVYHFIKDQQIVVSTAQLLHAEVPGFASRGAILFRVLGIPGEAVAHRVHLDTKFLSRLVFAVAIVARLHKLNHATLQTTSGGAHHQPQRAGSFTFAVASVNDQQSARLFLVVLATPLVFLLFGRHWKWQKTGDRIQNTELRRQKVPSASPKVSLILTPEFCLLSSIH